MKHCFFKFLVLCSLACMVMPGQAQVKIRSYKSMKSSGGKVILTSAPGEQVHLDHGNTSIFCDKAFNYQKDNRLEAFGAVKVKNQDGTTIISDYLDYNGLARKGKFRKNVKVIDENMNLTTDNLDFNSANNSGYFFGGGMVIDSNMVLISQTGRYFPDKKQYIFNDSVVVTDSTFTLYTDTLHYNLETNVALIFGPSEIHNDTNFMYCEWGRYDTNNGIANLSRNAYMHNPTQRMKGDSLYYNKLLGVGEAWGNVELIDSTEQAVLTGQYAYTQKVPEYAFITDSALFMYYTETDTFFMHADTLLAKYDTSSIFREIHCYNKVKAYRHDLQAKCDSMVYSLRDSIAYLYKQPVLWAADNQISAERIELITERNLAKELKLYKTAFMVSKEDTLRFNQVKGRDMVGHIAHNELYLIEVFGNGQTIYFPKEKGVVSGVNKTESANLEIYLKDRSVQRIKFIKNPIGDFSPPLFLHPKDLKLSDFRWMEELRPKNKRDVFEWRELRSEDETED